MFIPLYPGKADERFAFLAEWYDPRAALMRKYQMMYYPSDNSIEMYDIKNRRLFLKRSVIDGLKIHDFYIGAIVNIHTRQLTITDFADTYTTTRLKSINEQTLAMIKPDVIAGHLGSILEMIDKEGLIICQAKMVHLTRKDASEFYRDHASMPYYDCSLRNKIVVSATEKQLDFFALMKKNSGHVDVVQLISKYNTKNAAHGSDSPMSSEKEVKFFFGFSRKNSAKFDNCTLCIIKPHAVAEGMTGNIVKAIQEEGFEISALQMFHLERANAEEFHEVYKDVVNEYNDMVVELCSGPCMALEIRGLDVQRVFRQFVGPVDPEIARHLRPRTLRARFGKDKIQNAVHCTDIPEDGSLEVRPARCDQSWNFQ
ncbi:hypothetical protein QZH41_019161 [Actinostola sp. cb2023]|nr:hypothetical protein QZH41_019161 [Actinostola sp. cb2023]